MLSTWLDEWKLWASLDSRMLLLAKLHLQRVRQQEDEGNIMEICQSRLKCPNDCTDCCEWIDNNK